MTVPPELVPALDAFLSAIDCSVADPSVRCACGHLVLGHAARLDQEATPARLLVRCDRCDCASVRPVMN